MNRTTPPRPTPSIASSIGLAGTQEDDAGQALNQAGQRDAFESNPSTTGRPKRASMARILLISTNFPPVIGGAAIVYENICRRAGGMVVALAASNEYATGKPLAGTAVYDRCAGYSIYRMRVLHETDGVRRGKLAAIWSQIYDLILMTMMLFRVVHIARKERIDVICLGDLVYGGWLVFPLKYLFRYKVIFYIHGEEITTHSGGLFDECRAKFLAHADAVVSVSSFTRDAMTRLMGIDPAKIMVIQNGVDLDRFQVRIPPPNLATDYGVVGKRVILSVGRLVSRKGMDRLVEAMPRVLRDCPDTHLLIAGEGPLRTTLSDLIRTHGLEARVTLLGAVSDQALVDLYALAEIFALPNRELPDGDTEGFGLVFLEANASGKPVVSGRAGGVVDAVTDGVNGLTVDGNDVEAISAAIVRLLKDPALYQQLAQGGRYIAQRNDWHRRTAEFLALCDDTLSRNTITATSRASKARK